MMSMHSRLRQLFELVVADSRTGKLVEKTNGRTVLVHTMKSRRLMKARSRERETRRASSPASVEEKTFAKWETLTKKKKRRWEEETDDSRTKPVDKKKNPHLQKKLPYQSLQL